MAHEVGISVLETEVVEGSDGETSPGTGTNETIPSVLDGFTESLWEDSGVCFLENGEGEESKLNKLVGHHNVTIHGAGEFRHYTSVFINNYKI